MAFSSSLSPLPESATHIRSKVHRLAHTWTIDHFSCHCDDVLHRKDFLESSKFSPHKFNQERLQFFLRVHPRGNSEKAEQTKDHVPIYLYMQSNKSQSVSIKAKVSMVKASGEKCNTKEDTKELSNNGSLGWHDFVRRDHLLNTNNGLLADDQLIIHCKIVIQVNDGQLRISLKRDQSLNSLYQICTFAKTCWKVEKLSHIMTINNFSNLSLTGDYPSIISSTFNSPDNPEFKFALQLYPKGDRADAKDYISIFLMLKNFFVNDVYVKMTISLLNDKGKEHRKFDGKIVLSKCNGFGWSKYIPRATLFDTANQLLPDDMLTFSCEVLNFLDIETTSSSSHLAVVQEDIKLSQSEQAIYYGNLQQKILRTPRDITFVIGESKFPAHTLIFSAQSPVFDKMFEHDFEEKHSKQVNIVDIEADVFEQFMKFVYTGKVEKLCQFDEKLLIVSNKYQVDSLKRICEASLYSKLCPDNVICTLVLADMHNAEQLKADAIEFIKCEGSSIVKMNTFKDFLKSQPELAYEVVRSLVEYLEM